MRTILIAASALLCAALPWTSGCGRRDADPSQPPNKLSAKDKEARVEAIKKELEQLKAEIAELQGKAQSLQTDLEQAKGAPEK